ncbi:hypothetical protein SLEP1_g540 [Rubroshorea leprosula]|uniref:DOMON domain-containing protein n=1 Tax=Rubroshorea leprosula TaxID=152421 RepID=A0AAV5HB00_9ROSI|nr:hypothetical protein SLEP1_g540 [Rubroshorea leprosula]
MASMSFPSLILFLSFWVSLMSPACSLNCTSEKLPDSKKTFVNCTDLPTLNATLHYTYNATNSSLSVAFVAAPATAEGWTAWAINPTGTGMVGAQALLALKSKGSLFVKKYNISSYASIVETDKLAFDVWDLKVESGTSGKYVIYASLKVQDGVEKLNQVWQVGANATNGHPEKHEMAPQNLGSKAELQLVEKATAASPTGSPASAPAPTAGTNGGSRRVADLSLGGFALIVASIVF